MKQRLEANEANGKTVVNITASDLFEGAEKFVTVLPLQVDRVGDEATLTDYFKIIHVAPTSALDDSSRGGGSDIGEPAPSVHIVTPCLLYTSPSPRD